MLDETPVFNAVTIERARLSGEVRDSVARFPLPY